MEVGGKPLKSSRVPPAERGQCIVDGVCMGDLWLGCVGPPLMVRPSPALEQDTDRLTAVWCAT